MFQPNLSSRAAFENPNSRQIGQKLEIYSRYLLDFYFLGIPGEISFTSFDHTFEILPKCGFNNSWGKREEKGWIQKRTKSFYGWPLSMQIGNRILSLKSLVNWCSNLYFGYLPTYINLGTNYRVGSSKNQIGSDWIFGWESPNFGNLSSNSYNTNQNSSVSFDACHNEVKAILKS